MTNTFLDGSIPTRIIELVDLPMGRCMSFVGRQEECHDAHSNLPLRKCNVVHSRVVDRFGTRTFAQLDAPFTSIEDANERFDLSQTSIRDLVGWGSSADVICRSVSVWLSEFFCQTFQQMIASLWSTARLSTTPAKQIFAEGRDIDVRLSASRLAMTVLSARCRIPT